MIPAIATAVTLLGPPLAHGIMWWLDTIAEHNPGGWLARRRARKATRSKPKAKR